jgi:hypothetical protein
MPCYVAQEASTPADMHIIIRYSPPHLLHMVPRLTTAEYVAGTYIWERVRQALQAMRLMQQLSQRCPAMLHSGQHSLI